MSVDDLVQNLLKNTIYFTNVHTTLEHNQGYKYGNNI